MRSCAAERDLAIRWKVPSLPVAFVRRRVCSVPEIDDGTWGQLGLFVVASQ